MENLRRIFSSKYEQYQIKDLRVALGSAGAVQLPNAQSAFRNPGCMRFILFQNVCTQPLFQCVPVSFPRVKRPGREVTYLHLVSRLATNRAVILLSWYAFRASKGKTFTAAQFSYTIRQSNLLRLHINIADFVPYGP